jgi:hypothetical protein
MGYTRFPSAGSSSAPTVVTGNGIAGTPDPGVITVQGIVGGVPLSTTKNGSATGWLLFNDYSITPVTTAAYVQLAAALVTALNSLSIFDSSGSGMILAVGAPGSEVNQLYVPPGGNVAGYDISIQAGSRVSYKALTANATSGQLIITGLS